MYTNCDNDVYAVLATDSVISSLSFLCFWHLYDHMNKLKYDLDEVQTLYPTNIHMREHKHKELLNELDSVERLLSP